ncbi:MAG: hypothetical protein ACLPJJ_08980 [Acidocella sp.]|uniref:hypothetical protein n=1 Tax=Acidocella sp. TaxID=50710 RepID=UPI003FC83402
MSVTERAGRSSPSKACSTTRAPRLCEANEKLRAEAKKSPAEGSDRLAGGDRDIFFEGVINNRYKTVARPEHADGEIAGRQIEQRAEAVIHPRPGGEIDVEAMYDEQQVASADQLRNVCPGHRGKGL